MRGMPLSTLRQGEQRIGRLPVSSGAQRRTVWRRSAEGAWDDVSRAGPCLKERFLSSTFAFQGLGSNWRILKPGTWKLAWREAPLALEVSNRRRLSSHPFTSTSLPCRPSATTDPLPLVHETCRRLLVSPIASSSPPRRHLFATRLGQATGHPTWLLQSSLMRP